MTILAWDGTTLAADKRMSYGGHHNTVTKIFRAGDFIVGIAGWPHMIGALLRWLEKPNRDPRDFPQSSVDEQKIYALAISKDGRVWKFENSPWPMQIHDRHVTSGSGRDYARMAMHLGKTAREAVELTCEFDENCGNGVDTLTLDVLNEPSTSTPFEGRP